MMKNYSVATAVKVIDQAARTFAGIGITNESLCSRPRRSCGPSSSLTASRRCSNG